DLLEPDRAGGERRRAGWPGRAQQRRAAGRDRRDAARARGGAGVDSGGLVMIAKITRGERVGDIAAYLHGPGKANEHHYIQDKRRHIGGMVIASNIGAEGATDPAEWAADLRLARQQRPEITKPIWQASLRAAPGDRVMGDREWADIASRFMEEMGVGDHPWVAVRHGKDHVHVVVSRVSDTGEVWHGRNDRRTAQKVCTGIEQRHGLEQAPRRKAQPKKA